MSSSRAPGQREHGIRLSVLGSFDLRTADGTVLHPALTPEAQHLLALLAIKGRRISRSAIAGTLWPDASEKHAHASLRSALSRLGALAHDAVAISGTTLELSTAVTVDLHDARALAHRLLRPLPAGPSAADLEAGGIGTLSLDCLPDWYDEWNLTEAEEWRQLRLHALDALAIGLARADRFGDAIAASLAAIRVDPLRESAWVTLVRVHLAEGNQSEAQRAFSQFRDLLRRELQVEPSARIRELIPRRGDHAHPRRGGPHVRRPRA